MKLAVFLTFAPLVFVLSNFEVTFSTNYILLGKTRKKDLPFEATRFGNWTNNATVQVSVKNYKILNVEPSFIFVEPYNKSYNLSFEGKSIGHTKVDIFSEVENVRITHWQLVVDVYKYYSLYCISRILFWAYIILLTIAFYSQIVLNYKRKSVIGLSFDAILFFVVEHATFFIFYFGLNYLSSNQDDQFKAFPSYFLMLKQGSMIYNINGLVVISIITVQCFLYESGNQKVSVYAKTVFTLILLFALFFMAWRGFRLTKWLNRVYSFLVIIVSAFKFFPQIFLNYKRKSTKGLSMVFVNFKLLGGILILLQLMLDSFNFGDWSLIFKIPIMIAVAIINITLSVFILIQRYYLYKIK
ncbi:hypothetical protein RN001_012323 [Aquatica leii]|uniref:Uncharacterized protein n=1 Tax=Aquatica leii TaxID=1421715 RepID=A0AAN7P755_9COLE|nr:hypothetical protein RN001_012323 [Aquatica leii]